MSKSVSEESDYTLPCLVAGPCIATDAFAWIRHGEAGYLKRQFRRRRSQLEQNDSPAAAGEDI